MVSVSSQTDQCHQSRGVFVLWIGQDRSNNTSAIMTLSVVFRKEAAPEVERAESARSSYVQREKFSTG